MRVGDDIETTPCRHCGLPVTTARSASADLFCCFGCRLANGLARQAAAEGPGDAESAPPTTLLLRLGLGIFLALNIMAVSWLSYARDLFGPSLSPSSHEPVLGGLFSYLALFLCTGVLALLAAPLLSASRPSSSRLPSTHRLILLGVVSAYLVSVAHTVRGHGSLYFDTAAMVLVAVTLGGHLEATAKRRATRAAFRLLSVLPRRVRRLVGGQRDSGEEEVPLGDVAVGDRLRFLPGDVIAVDGRVVQGASRLDTSSLTGESQGREVVECDAVLAGSLNQDGELWVRAEEVGDDTVLAFMERSLDDARRDPPPVQRLADRVSRVFVPAVVLIAVGTLVVHVVRGQPAEGLLAALSVLLISCPCALGLAAPLATWQGLRRAAEVGVLVDSAATLEHAGTVDHLVFDKTGTLTRPYLVLGSIAVAPGVDEDEALRLAASLEAASHHPIALAVQEVADRKGVGRVPLTSVRQRSGWGIEGCLSTASPAECGGMLYLGGRRLASARGLAEDPLAGGSGGDNSALEGALSDPDVEGRADTATHELFLMDGSRILALFDLRESLRPGAHDAVAQLRRLGVGVCILSGDGAGPTARVARHLAVAAEGGLLPDDKVRRLQALRASGLRVAMVGDGLNDAPVMAAADLGIALGSATQVTQSAGNVRLTSDRLERIPHLIRLARHVRRRIVLNLSWAFGFNGVGIVLAAAGRLTPAFAAVAMILSSLIVIRLSMSAGRLEDLGADAAGRPRAVTPPITKPGVQGV